MTGISEATALGAEIERLRAELAKSQDECLRMHAAGTRMAELYDAVFKCCKVVFYPSIDDPLGDYPIEHAPSANKDAREAITQRLEAWLDAQGAAVLSGATNTRAETV